MTFPDSIEAQIELCDQQIEHLSRALVELRKKRAQLFRTDAPTEQLARLIYFEKVRAEPDWPAEIEVSEEEWVRLLTDEQRDRYREMAHSVLQRQAQT